jgi:CHAT domain-containing protein
MLGMFLANISFAQCPPPQKWMESVIVIEQSDNTPLQKIKSFTSLGEDYARCRSQRDSIYARITHRLGDLYRVTGDFEKGIALTREAVNVNKVNAAFSQPAFLAHSYYNLGLYFSLLNMTTEAHLYFDSCIEVGSRYPQKAFIALMAFEQKAFIYFKTGDYENSVFTADRGISALNNSDPLRHALLLLQRAQALAELGRVDEAEREVHQSVRMLNANGGEAFIANANSVEANVLSRQKRYKEAILKYTKAFEANQLAKNWEQCSRDQQDLGMLYDHELKRSAPALNCYRKAISLTEITHDLYTRASLYTNIGLVYVREKNFPEALHYFQIGLNTLPIQFGDTAIASNPDENQLKRLANDYVGLMILASKAEALMDWHKVTGNKELLQQSLSVFLLVDVMIDQMRWNQSDGLSHIFWRGKTRQWYEKALEVCYRLGDTDHAFYFLEKSRAVLLNDKINELNATSRLSPDDYKTDQQLRIRVVTAQQRLASGDTPAASQEVFNAQRAQHTFIKGLEKKYPLYYQYRYERAVTDLFRFRKEYLGTNQSLISYFNGDSAWFALVVRPDSVFFRRIGAPDLQGDVSRFLTLLSDYAQLNSHFEEYRDLARGLYEAVFEPLHISTTSLIVLHDQYFIPMDALMKNDSHKSRYLIEDFEVSYGYSASFLFRVNRAPRASTRILAIAPVEFHENLKQQTLAGSDVSLERMTEYLPGANLVLKRDATKRNFMSKVPEFDVVHLYSHADPDYDGEPVLYFYDSMLNVSELQTLGKLQTSMISLFACHTGVGKNVAGEGTFSLARGFAASGIPATVTTMWTLDNRAAYTLAELFYKHVHSGKSTSSALRLAKIELLHSHNKEYALPFFWAGTVLLGPSQNFDNGARQDMVAMPLILLSVVGISMLVIGVVFVMKRRKTSPHVER